MQRPLFEDLSIAAESLESAVSISSEEETMRFLFGLLDEHGFDGDALDDRGERIVSVPAPNRGTMVAEPMDRVPWKTAFLRFLRPWRRELFGSARRKTA